MVNDHKIFDESKIQLTMKIKFISSNNGDESQQMQSKEIIISIDTDEIIGELSNSILHRYKECLEQSMKGSDFVFDYVDGLFYKCHKSHPLQSIHRYS